MSVVGEHINHYLHNVALPIEQPPTDQQSPVGMFSRKLNVIVSCSDLQLQHFHKNIIRIRHKSGIFSLAIVPDNQYIKPYLSQSILYDFHVIIPNDFSSPNRVSVFCISVGL